MARIRRILYFPDPEGDQLRHDLIPDDRYLAAGRKLDKFYLVVLISGNKAGCI